MAKQILKNAGIYIGGVDYSDMMNSVEVTADADLPDVTTFGAVNREYLKGIRGARFGASGFVDMARDASLHTEWQSTAQDQEVSIVADNAPGGTGIMMRGTLVDFGKGKTMGQAATLTIGGITTMAPVVRGRVMARQLGATAAGAGPDWHRSTKPLLASESIYGSLHVFHKAGTAPTMTMLIESDDNSGFASAVTRLSFDPMTDIGSQWKEATPGAVSDTHWRARWTIGGTTPVFGFVVLFGVNPTNA